SYRKIGLESCLLKTVTLLVEPRLCAWGEGSHGFPDEHNGFRTGHRTENNTFVLKVVIEQARAMNEPLHTVFVHASDA
ncbi:uncharacterized protein BXZ73DRAFT_16906, partial [Epithele typhae]|uniref:uncharacterized protein n=1 Tax=Epithele typhae TaxID=378194 RepID=UPI002008859F